MASATPPCHLHAIKTVWATVEPFLDIQSTIRASQACRALHEEIVDADTRKIKVSRFSSRSGPWETVPYYLPLALDAIHFPSLLYIHLTFPALISPGEGIQDIYDSPTSCFPIFVTHLASARNVERLYVNLGGVLINGYNLSFEPLLRIFGRNLARCKKLTSLILLCADQEEYCPYLVTETLLSLTPVIRQQKDVLREFGINFRTNQFHDPTPSEAFPSAATNFFGAVLSCTDLETLEIHLQHSPILTDGLLEAAKQKCSSKNYSPFDHCLHLQVLGLDLDLGMTNDRPEGRVQEQYLKAAHMLFKHFSHGEQLRRVHLHLPLDIWADQIDTIASMLSKRPTLTEFCFMFCGYADDDGKAINLLEKCFVGKYDTIDLQVQELRKVDGRRLFQLMECARASSGSDDYAQLEGFASVDSEDGEDETEEVERREVGSDVLEEDMPERVDIEDMWL
ncbi:hypothetical protein ACHAXT_005651 [Thalassiosira profunda]